jgi:preprotein translocase subunit SecG
MMLNWTIGILTTVLVLDCMFLILLILVQLPKKEAGLGQAFGGGTTDALFGAGSGNALTIMTKYSAAIFFVLTLSLSILNGHTKTKTSTLQENLQKLGKGDAPAPTLPVNPELAPVGTNAIPAAPGGTSAVSTPSAPKATSPVPAPSTAKGTNSSAAPAPK